MRIQSNDFNYRLDQYGDDSSGARNKKKVIKAMSKKFDEMTRREKSDDKVHN